MQHVHNACMAGLLLISSEVMRGFFISICEIELSVGWSPLSHNKSTSFDASAAAHIKRAAI